MTILEHFTKGLKQHEWDYYSNRDKQENQENLSLIENWNDAINHVNFIQEYLRISGKMEVIQNFEYSGLALNSFPRAAHTNSAFFLGCVLYKELKLMSKINFTRKDGNDEFFFIWFLSSLLHDFGYHIENCPNNCNQYKKLKEIKDFLTEFKVEHNLANINIKSIQLEQNTLILFSNIEKYYEARKDGKIGRDGEGKIDHGIAAGFLLYNSLVKNRKYREESNSEKIRNGEELDGLYWGKELERFYAIASSAIATHNMRRGVPEKTDDLNVILLKYKLEKLILNGEDGHIKKLNIETDTFAFLFALADSLEPIKIYENYFDKTTILKSISIDISFNKITFENTNEKLNFEPFIKNIKNLKSWMNIQITKEKLNLITMEIL